MSFVVHEGGAGGGAEVDAAEAAAWVVRLSGEEVSPSDLAAFDRWLAASPRRGEAYDAALAVWSLPMARPAEDRAPRPRRAGSRTGWASGVAAALALAAALLVTLFVGRPDVYRTAPGERREIALADGSRVSLAGATRLEVRLRRARRELRLDGGEAMFDVRHDAARPFVITAGARSVQVLGTAFDVAARAGSLDVAVTRGLVEVRDPSAGALRLARGDRARYAAPGAAPRRSQVEPAEVASWRRGQLIYHDAALEEVVAGLNAQLAGPPLHVTPAAARLRFSGVLMLDDRATVWRRLTYALPVTLTRRGDEGELDLAAAAGR